MINIRLMEYKDKKEVLCMMKEFYSSDAVLTNGPEDVLIRDIEDSISDNPYIDGYIFEVDDCRAGYSMVAKSYSTEFGGLCIWIEDIFIKSKYRSLGIGKKYFDYIENLYKGKAYRFRLEAEVDNNRALEFYFKRGYKNLPYMQLTKENI